MSNLEQIKTRLDKLIDMGETVLRTKSYSEWGSDPVDSALFHQWKTSSLSFLRKVFGEKSDHYGLYKELCDYAQHYKAERGLAVLKSAKDDIEAGFLKSLEALVSADIFKDFLEMAGHLLQNGYKDPAASLIGAVLEDGLSKISKREGVKVKSKEDLSSLNQKLAQAGVYNRLTQKRIQVWNDIRNNADHGNFSEYDSDLVREMLQGVTAFLEQYL